MGIGRREFLKFVGMALAGTSIDPATRVFAQGDYFVNQALGLGFIKPAGWMIEAFEDFSHIIEGTIYTDPKVQGAVAADSHKLVAVVSKYGSTSKAGYPERFTPAVAIHVESATDNEELGGLESLMRDAEVLFQRILEDFEMLQNVEALSISKCRAYRFKARFHFRHRKLEPMPVDMVFYVIDAANGRHYTVQGMDSPYIGEGAQRELDRFFSSLRLV